MSRISCKTCRRLGESLCGREKCAYKKRPYAPGKLDSERKHRSSSSEYGEQLRAKQKMRITYGLMEKQFSMYVKRAMDHTGKQDKETSPALKLYRELESRLDNIVFRAGFAIHLTNRLRNSLRPVTPDNARILRMTAAAGT
jgi:small subunit ribosomal protein S4